MHHLLPLVEIAFFATVVCLFHRSRAVLSRAPFYALIGLFEAFIFVADKAEPGASPIVVEFFGDATGYLGYTLFLPLLLSSLVLVYALEGTAQARRVLGALVALHIVHALIDVTIAYHAGHPPAGFPDLSGSAIAEYSLTTRAFSLIAFLADAVVIIVVYQALVNRLRKVPLAVLIFVALVVAMINDGLAFGTLYGLAFSVEGLQLAEKAQAAIAAAIPVAIYLNRQFKRHQHEVMDGVVDRKAFEIVDLRKQVTAARDRLEQQQARLAHVQDVLGRYVSPEIGRIVLEHPERVRLGGEMKDVTVMFADIAGYTRIAESLSPPEVLTLLNRYLEAVSDDILDEKGLIVEYEGDGVLAAFGAPIDLPDHGERAVRAAQRMLESVERLNRLWAEDGTIAHLHSIGMPKLTVRIGLHSGRVVAGNIGSASRMKYGIIGDTVNAASRVEQLNKTLMTTLLFTHETLEQLSDVQKADVIDHGSHQVRGRAEPLHVYSLRSAPVAGVRSDVLPVVA